VLRCLVGKLYALKTNVMYQVEVFIRSRRPMMGFFLFSILFAVMQCSVFASASVTLAWNKSTNSIVTGYNVYYGGAGGIYTNKICAGCKTNVIISGLVQGTTYYFAATTYTSLGIESPFSSEMSYLIPQSAPMMNYSNIYTAVVTANAPGYFTNKLHQIRQIPSLSTNYVFSGFWIYFPPSGAWTLQSSSNLVIWSDYATGTNAVFVPNTGGNCFFRFKSS
jgi:hypothetical protein